MNAVIQLPVLRSEIISRLPRAEYDALPGLSISRLKELRRSPLHYRHALTAPKESSAIAAGNAAHVAVLEPERYAADFAVWDSVTASGKASPRNGKAWDEFRAANDGRTIITADEHDRAQGMANAVRSNEHAMRYLETGDPEVTMLWSRADTSDRQLRSRADWITRLFGDAWIVGLKTSRDCRHFAFGSQAAKLGYHLQWAYYHDAYEAITGVAPRMVEIVVENEPPHAVAVYLISNDIIEQGREEYCELIKLLDECEATNNWPGPQQAEEFLTLPSWVYGTQDDDISTLGLEP